MSKPMLALLTSALILTGCASGGPPMPDLPKRLPPPNLTTDCPDLPQPRSARGADLLDNHVQTAELYHECRERQRALAEWARNDGQK